MKTRIKTVYNAIHKIPSVFAFFLAIVGLCPGTTFAQSCAPPPAGLVSWWPGNGNHTEVDGTNNGTLHGQITFATGKVGQAFSSDGNGSAVLVGNPASFQLQDFTIEAWVERGSVTKISTGNEGGIVFGYGSGGYTLGMLDDGTPLLSQVDISGVFGTQKITDTAFHHLAVTKSRSTVEFYVDGTASSAPAYNPTFPFH